MPESTSISPLAKELFSFPFVDRVFFAGNFVTVTKKEEVEWIEIQSTLRIISRSIWKRENLSLKLKMTVRSLPVEEETDTIKKIKTILEEYIRPAVEQDGGAITYHSFHGWNSKSKIAGFMQRLPFFHDHIKSGYRKSVYTNDARRRLNP